MTGQKNVALIGIYDYLIYFEMYCIDAVYDLLILCFSQLDIREFDLLEKSGLLIVKPFCKGEHNKKIQTDKIAVYSVGFSLFLWSPLVFSFNFLKNKLCFTTLLIS